jgi:3-hydroxyisobutyrate dehydrogenase-like beta-hydroxyacid dehydrogenase
MRIAFLGLGRMGVRIAHLLQQQGHQLTVWNRTPAAAAPLAAGGAQAAGSAAEAVAGMPVVFTMLSDDAATSSVVFGAENKRGILEAMERDAIHISFSTISVGLSRLLTASHQRQGQHFVAAPVFGRPPIAEQGKLWIAAGGSQPAVERVRPLLEAVSRGITVVADEPWRAHALKLGGNFMIAAMVQAISEALVFAASQEIPLDLFAETVNSALFQSALYTQYGQNMLHPPQVPGSTVALGSKDLALFREAAAAAGRHLPLADYIAQQLHRAQEAGLKDQEWAVGQYHIAQSTAGIAPGSGEPGNPRFDIS